MRPPTLIRIPACLGAAVAALLAFFFVWVAVTVPFPEEDERFVETSDRIWTEALILPIAACLGYAAYGLTRYVLGEQVRWRLVTGALVVGVLATPIAWMFLIRTYSGG